MLLVKDSMTREIVTLAPDETWARLACAGEGSDTFLSSDWRLVVIVSDRDLRSPPPLSETTRPPRCMRSWWRT